MTTKSTGYNTDNKGKLACHGFCEEVPATKTAQEWELHPDPRTARNQIPATMTTFWLRDNPYRDTALCRQDSSETPWQLRNLQATLGPTRHEYHRLLVPGRQKHAPYPPCTVKVSRPNMTMICPVLRRVTQPPFIAGPLALINFQSSNMIFLKFLPACPTNGAANHIQESVINTNQYAPW